MIKAWKLLEKFYKDYYKSNLIQEKAIKNEDNLINSLKKGNK